MTFPNDKRDPKSGRFLNKNQLAIQHGLWVMKRTGKFPAYIRGARILKRELQEMRKELEAITPDLNVKKQLLINQICSASGFMGLVELYVKKVGLPRADQWRRKVFDVQPAFQFYLSMARLQIQCIQVLGLDLEQAEAILTPYQIVEKEEKKKSDEHNNSLA